MKKTILFTGLLFATLASFAQLKAEEKVKESIMAIHNAIFVQKDSAVLEGLITTELTYGHSGGKIENRLEMISAVAKSKSVYTNVSAKIISVSVQNKTAVSRYLLIGTETKPDGKVTELKLNILQVWVKVNKVWKMMARQAVKVS